GLRVALDSALGHPSRFGIAPDEIAAAGRRARQLGLALEVLSAHLVSTDFTAPLGVDRSLGSSVRVAWAKSPEIHARAASTLARLAVELGVQAVDIGGGIPAADASDEYPAAVASALRETGFAGRLMLEPGRAIVADAVDL